MIKLEHVDKYFGDLHVLKDVNLEVAEGEKLVIIGPSGSGKSTTVRCMNFLEEPTSGHVYIDGQELTNKNVLCLMLILNSILCLKSIYFFYHFTDRQRIWDIPSPGNHRTGRDFRRNSSLYKNILSPILCSTFD